MMTISNGNGAMNNVQPVHANMNMQSDPVSKGIQDQIINAQKQLQELGANKDMTPEEKMKRRQEIQQEINNLNQQLRQHQIEKRKEQQAKSASKNEESGNSQKENTSEQGAGLSTASMQAMISADSSIKLAKVQGSTATQMEGRAGVLKVEIKLDGSRGGDTSAKEAELAKVEQKAESATNSQLNTLAEANQTMAKAAEADKAENKTNSENEDSRTDQAADDKQQMGGVSKADSEDKSIEQDTQAPETLATSENTTVEKTDVDLPYVQQKHIDIRL